MPKLHMRGFLRTGIRVPRYLRQERLNARSFLRTEKMVRAGDPHCAWSQSGADQALARFLVRAIDLQGKHREPQASKGRARASLVTSTCATRFDAPRHSTKLGEIPLPTSETQWSPATNAHYLLVESHCPLVEIPCPTSDGSHTTGNPTTHL